MPFAPENPLEEVLQRAVSDPSVRPQFYDLLMQSPLFVLGRVEGHHTPDEVLPNLFQRRFELAQIHVQGNGYHPVFTARSRMHTFAEKPECHFITIGKNLFANTRGGAFLINYGSDVGKELLPQEIAHVLDTLPAKPRTEIVIGQPDPYPGKLTGALGMLFLNRAQIVSAHLVQTAVKASGEPPHLLIGLVGHGNLSRIIAEIGEVATSIRTTNSVDVLVLDPTDTRSELQNRLLAVPPFYAHTITPH